MVEIEQLWKHFKVRTPDFVLGAFDYIGVMFLCWQVDLIQFRASSVSPWRCLILHFIRSRTTRRMNKEEYKCLSPLFISQNVRCFYWKLWCNSSVTLHKVFRSSHSLIKPLIKQSSTAIAMRTYSWLAGPACHGRPPSPGRRFSSVSLFTRKCVRAWKPVNENSLHTLWFCKGSSIFYLSV